MVRAERVSALAERGRFDAIREASRTRRSTPDDNTGITSISTRATKCPSMRCCFRGPRIPGPKSLAFRPCAAACLPLHDLGRHLYVLRSDREPLTGSSGNAFKIPNSDFIVTLGAWENGEGGTDAQKIGTFIHDSGTTWACAMAVPTTRATSRTTSA